jgi:hypothetical protein
MRIHYISSIFESFERKIVSATGFLSSIFSFINGAVMKSNVIHHNGISTTVW